MKQHVLPKQLMELSKEQLVDIYNTTCRRGEELNTYRKDFYEYHHKKFSIGKLVELLGDNLYCMTRNELNGDWFVVIGEWNGYRIDNQNLCDALWEGLKYTIKNRF